MYCMNCVVLELYMYCPNNVSEGHILGLNYDVVLELEPIAFICNIKIIINIINE